MIAHEAAIAAALALTQSATVPAEPDAKPQPVTTVEPVMMGSLTIPDEIAPAAMIYMNCLMASRGTNFSLRPGERDPRPADIALGGDCSAYRARAAHRADEMLRGQHRLNAQRRRELIETTLNSVDDFVSPGESRIVPSASQRAAMSRAGTDPMRAIDVPYQAIPAYTVYSQCVAARLNSDSRAGGADAGGLLQANADAIAACRAVRAEQLERALAAQTDNRPYDNNPAMARAAIRRAFDRFDSDYQIETDSAAPKGQ